jgi:uncharacterized protein YndB with AHSA1/START domain
MNIQHDTFEMNETFDCSVEKLFDAFVDPVIKRAWYADHAGGHSTDLYELDASVGGRETFHITLSDKTPVPGMKIQMESECVARIDQRLLVQQSRMRHAGSTVSITNESFEFSSAPGGGALLKLNQQGIYLEGSDGPQLRRSGHEQVLRHLRDWLGA